MRRGFQLRESSPGLRGRLPDRAEKFLRRYVRRTGRRREDAAGPQMRDAASGQFAIRLNGSGSFRFLFSQRGRIENYQIEFPGEIFSQPIESIGLKELVPASGHGETVPVQRKIILSRMMRLQTDTHGHCLRAGQEHHQQIQSLLLLELHQEQFLSEHLITVAASAR